MVWYDVFAGTLPSWEIVIPIIQMIMLCIGSDAFVEFIIRHIYNYLIYESGGVEANPIRLIEPTVVVVN